MHRQIRIIGLASLLLAALLASTVPASGQTSLSVGHWQVEAIAADAVMIELGGMWRDGCPPAAPVARVSGDLVVLAMEEVRPGTGCGFAFTGWQHQVQVDGLSAGHYRIEAGYHPWGDPDALTLMGSHEFDFQPRGMVPQGVPFTPWAWLVLAGSMLLLARRYRRRLVR